MKSLNNINEIKNKFKSILNERSEQEGLEHDAFMLMAGYLSEIEKIQEVEGLKRKELANKIKTSASYLTQVFRGNKPLNFYTLAKIQRALKIRFQVSSFSINKAVFSVNSLLAKPVEKNDYPNSSITKTYTSNMYIVKSGNSNLNHSKTA